MISHAKAVNEITNFVTNTLLDGANHLDRDLEDVPVYMRHSLFNTIMCVISLFIVPVIV